VKGHREGRRVRFRLRAEAPELSELLGWALSGAGPEAMAAVASPGRESATVRPIPTKAGRRVRPASATIPPGESGHVPIADAESGGSKDPLALERADLPAVAGSIRVRRPDDLEDYLL
jgi:hypothetical protein